MPTEGTTWQTRVDVEDTMMKLFQDTHENIKQGKDEKNHYRWLSIVGPSGVGKTRQGWRSSKILTKCGFPAFKVQHRFRAFDITRLKDARTEAERQGTPHDESMGVVLDRVLVECISPETKFEEHDSPEGVTISCGEGWPSVRQHAMRQIRGKMAESAVVVVQLDEFQVEKKTSQDFLRAVRDSLKVQVAEQVAIIPVLTGTVEREVAKDGFSNSATDYSVERIYLEPLPHDNICNLGASFLTKRFSARFWEKDEASFRLFMSGAAGIPRTAISLCRSVETVLKPLRRVMVDSGFPWGIDRCVYAQAWANEMNRASLRLEASKELRVQLLRKCMDKSEIGALSSRVIESDSTTTYSVLEMAGFLILQGKRVSIPPIHLPSIVGHDALFELGVSYMTLNPFFYRRVHDISWNAFEHIVCWTTVVRANLCGPKPTVGSIFVNARGHARERSKKLNLPSTGLRFGGIKPCETPFDEPLDGQLFLTPPRSKTADAWARIGSRVLLLQMKWSDCDTAISWPDVYKEYEKATGSAVSGLREHLAGRPQQPLFVLVTNRRVLFKWSKGKAVHERDGELGDWPSNLLVVSQAEWLAFRGGMFEYSL